MKNTTQKAFDFLAKRNPFDLPQAEYIFQLMEFQNQKGDDAIEALAGLYLYAIDNKGKESSRMIETTFAHDLSGRNDKWCEPRSTHYREFWLKELGEDTLRAFQINQGLK